MRALGRDIRHGIRVLGKSPGFTIVAILTLALGLGANAAIFSVVDAMLLRPLPIKDPGQITVLAHQDKHGALSNNFSIADYDDIRSQTDSAFSTVFGYQIGLDGLSVNGKADRIVTSYVTGNYFSALGIRPALGRFILPSDGETAGAAQVVVLGYSFWKARFGGDASVVGSKVLIDGHPLTVVGVAPETFHGLFPLLEMQAYLPLGLVTYQGYPSDIFTNRHLQNVNVFGRLRSSMSLAQAGAALGVVAQRLSREYPDVHKDESLRVFLETRARPQPDPSNTLMLLSSIFLSLAVLVLVLACVNVANILLVRATVREREMAIRAALGAGRAGLIRQLLAESLLLGLAGGLAGMLLGVLGSSALSSMNIQTDLAVRLDFGLDWRVFSYTFAAALATGLIVGMVPALRASRRNLSQILHSGGRGLVGGRSRTRNALVMLQVAGSLTLLIVAGLFTRSLNEVRHFDLGFDPEQVLNLTMDPNQIGYTPAEIRTFYKGLLSRVRELPGVESASTASFVPMGYYADSSAIEIEGYQPPSGDAKPGAGFNVVSPGYFQTMRIGLIHGRAFQDGDTDTAPQVAILNEAMAKKFWPNQEPIGRRFRMPSDPKRWIQVIGVAKDSRRQGLKGPIGPFFYLPFAQHDAQNSMQTLQIRTRVPPRSMIPAAERAIASLAPALPVFDVKTMREALYTLNGLLQFQIGAGLAAVLGLLGLVLAVVGVYGVISYAASQQTHEIGVRMALGAQPASILRMMLSQGLRIVGIGLLIGLAGALGAATVIKSFLMVSATDPLTYFGVSALLTTIALLACYIPARRAMRVDPMIALRYE